MKYDRLLSIGIVSLAVGLFFLNMTILFIDPKIFWDFGWKSSMEFKIVNTIFIAYLGIILISAAKWPYACGLFRKLIGATGVEVKKRRRDLLIIGLFAIVMSLVSYMPFLYP